MCDDDDDNDDEDGGVVTKLRMGKIELLLSIEISVPVQCTHARYEFS